MSWKEEQALFDKKVRRICFALSPDDGQVDIAAKKIGMLALQVRMDTIDELRMMMEKGDK